MENILQEITDVKPEKEPQNIKGPEKNGNDIEELGGKIEKIAKYCNDGIEELGNKIKKVEEEIFPIKAKVNDHDERIKALENKVAKNEKDINIIRNLAQEAIRLGKYAVQWWWPLLVAVLGIVALIIFTFANIFFAILTISAVVITVLAAIASWYYFRHKPNQQE